MNIMRYNPILFFAAVLLILPILANAQGTGVGCCLNPGAAALACSAERLSFLSECCTKPESANPSYYDALNLGPQNYNDCANNFFLSGQSCDSVNKCQQGCCCFGISGEIKTMSQCSAAGSTFHVGKTNCNVVCNIPQCNDRLDNDANGCIDFPADSGCNNQADNAEEGGICLSVSGQNCDSINYAPKITNFIAVPFKGQKKIELKWDNECIS